MIELGQKGCVPGEENLVPLEDPFFSKPWIYGKPTRMPRLQVGQSLVCAFHRYVTARLFICQSIDDVHILWDLIYVSGAGDKLEWLVGYIEKGIFIPSIRP